MDFGSWSTQATQPLVTGPNGNGHFVRSFNADERAKTQRAGRDLPKTGTGDTQPDMVQRKPLGFLDDVVPSSNQSSIVLSDQDDMFTSQKTERNMVETGNGDAQPDMVPRKPLGFSYDAVPSSYHSSFVLSDQDDLFMSQKDGREATNLGDGDAPPEVVPRQPPGVSEDVVPSINNSQLNLNDRDDKSQEREDRTGKGGPNEVLTDKVPSVPQSNRSSFELSDHLFKSPKGGEEKVQDQTEEDRQSVHSTDMFAEDDDKKEEEVLSDSQAPTQPLEQDKDEDRQSVHSMEMLSEGDNKIEERALPDSQMPTQPLNQDTDETKLSVRSKDMCAEDDDKNKEEALPDSQAPTQPLHQDTADYSRMSLTQTGAPCDTEHRARPSSFNLEEDLKLTFYTEDCSQASSKVHAAANTSDISRSNDVKERLLSSNEVFTSLSKEGLVDYASSSSDSAGSFGKNGVGSPIGLDYNRISSQSSAESSSQSFLRPPTPPLPPPSKKNQHPTPAHQEQSADGASVPLSFSSNGDLKAMLRSMQLLPMTQATQTKGEAAEAEIVDSTQDYRRVLANQGQSPKRANQEQASETARMKAADEISAHGTNVRVQGHSVVIDCASTQDVRQVLEMTSHQRQNKKREGRKEEEKGHGTKREGEGRKEEETKRTLREGEGGPSEKRMKFEATKHLLPDSQSLDNPQQADEGEGSPVIHPLTGLVINSLVHKAHRVGLSKLAKVPPLHATRK